MTRAERCKFVPAVSRVMPQWNTKRVQQRGDQELMVVVVVAAHPTKKTNTVPITVRVRSFHMATWLCGMEANEVECQ